jgi:hypothetical protein
VFHLNYNPTIITDDSTKMAQKQDHASITLPPSLHHDTPIKVTLVAGMLAPYTSFIKVVPVQTWCTQRRIRVPSQTLFCIKIICCCLWSICNAFPDKEVRNKTAIHQLVKAFQDTGSICQWQVLIVWQNRWNYSQTRHLKYVSSNMVYKR